MRGIDDRRREKWKQKPCFLIDAWHGMYVGIYLPNLLVGGCGELGFIRLEVEGVFLDGLIDARMNLASLSVAWG